MANVSFKRGLQASIDAILKDKTSVVEGAFYLTTDTDRLYFAQSEKELVHLNQYVVHVAKVEDLPPFNEAAVGDFYYAEQENILCTKRGGAEQTGWTQINQVSANTDLDTQLTSVTIDATEATDSAINYSVSIDTKVIDRVHGNNEIESLKQTTSGTFSITKENLDTVYANAGISISGDSTNNAANVKLDNIGDSEKDKDFSIAGSNNIDVSVSGTELALNVKNVIFDSELTSGGDAESATITLTNTISADGGDTESMDITLSGDQDVIVSGAENGITFAHKEYTTESQADLGEQKPPYGEKFNIISGIEVSNGHIAGISTNTVAIPKLTDIGINADGKIVATVTDGAGTGKAVTGSNSIIEVLKNSFYTEEEIDTQFADHLKTVNAMTFKGGVNALPTTASIGDTYIVTSAFKDSDKDIDVSNGDIIIAYSATGEENDDGVIADANLRWTVVYGTETDTTYTFNVDSGSNMIQLTASSGGDAQKIELVDDDIVTLTASDSNKIVAAHKKYDAANEAAAEPQNALYPEDIITIVEKIELDEDYGHVKAITNKKVKMPVSNYFTLNEDKAVMKDGSGNARGSICVDGDDKIKIAATTNASNDITFTATHAAVTVNKPAAGAGTIQDNKFIAITGVNADETGHLSEVIASKFTLPAYKLADSDIVNSVLDGETVRTDIATVQVKLQDAASASDLSTAAFNIASNTLELTAGNNQLGIDLVWGSF